MAGDSREDDRRLAVLMRAAQDGDNDAYRRLLAEILPIVRRLVVARRRFLDPADIEDLVQDILLSVHAVRQTFDPDRPFLPWLIVIARNRIADGGRKYLRRAANEAPESEHAETFLAAEAKTEEEYGDPEALRQALAGLPEGQRRAVELLKLKELSLKEASAVTGMSIAALKVAVHRGIKALKLVLNSGD